MKFTLLVVGRTVEKHYITAINDYVERTKHFISFDMEVIPELKNTKNLSMEQQKEKEGHELIPTTPAIAVATAITTFKIVLQTDLPFILQFFLKLNTCPPST